MVVHLGRAPRKLVYFIQVIAHRYLRFPSTGRIFSHSVGLRSDSENGVYAKSVASALRSQRNFNNFKRDYHYREILEHVSYDHGNKYLDILNKRKDLIFERALKSVLIDDSVGNPMKYKYDNINIPLSPTTLRYLKVASDLRGLFGDNLGSVAEIGCGYGGQAYTNDQLLCVDFATLFDLSFVNKLIERYLNTMLLNGAYRTMVINQAAPEYYDLVISNYAFSELPSKLQQTYIRKVLANSKRGYLTMNSGLGGPRSIGKLTLSDLREVLPDFEVLDEEPLTSPHNYIIVWGHDQIFSKRYMTVKTV